MSKKKTKHKKEGAKEKFFQKPDRSEIITVIYIIAVFFLLYLRDILGLYDNMTGREGLRNIIISIMLGYVCGAAAALPVLIMGVRAGDFTRKNRKDMSRTAAWGIYLLAVGIPVIIFAAFNRTRLNEQQYIMDRNTDFSLLAACISDYFSDDYDEYIADSFYFYRHKHTTLSGRGGSSYHSEYTVSGYYRAAETAYNSIFEAQIGKENYRYLKATLPKGFDTKVTVYKKSGFIRSIEPTVDFDRGHSYENYYEIYFNDGIITRTEPEGGPKAGNLMWCGFRSGESGSIENSLFGINARDSLEYPYSDLVNYKELCLYGTVDGEYRRVSNIIYSTGRSLGEIAEIYDKQQ